MIIEVDPASPTPPYEQIRAQIATMVEAGALPAGTQLPTIRQLAADLGLAANTVARAYRELEVQGLVVSRVRHGTTVASRWPSRRYGGASTRPRTRMPRWPASSVSTPTPPRPRSSAPCGPARTHRQIRNYSWPRVRARASRQRQRAGRGPGRAHRLPAHIRSSCCDPRRRRSGARPPIGHRLGRAGCPPGPADPTVRSRSACVFPCPQSNTRTAVNVRHPAALTGRCG
jgi:DNA-binding transcriptional regulator YhcF (GntR family)